MYVVRCCGLVRVKHVHVYGTWLYNDMMSFVHIGLRGLPFVPKIKSVLALNTGHEKSARPEFEGKNRIGEAIDRSTHCGHLLVHNNSLAHSLTLQPRWQVQVQVQVQRQLWWGTAAPRRPTTWLVLAGAQTRTASVDSPALHYCSGCCRGTSLYCARDCSLCHLPWGQREEARGGKSKSKSKSCIITVTTPCNR